MKKDEFQFLMDYNYWANARILQAAARISPEQYTAPFPVSFGSLRGTLVHIIGAEIVWRLRIQGDLTPYHMVSENELPTLAPLEERWSTEEKAMCAFLSSLDEEGAERMIQYKNSRGVAMETVLWQILAHVCNHGTQFRAEAAVILTQLGQSPGDLDLIYFVRSLQ